MRPKNDFTFWRETFDAGPAAFASAFHGRAARLPHTAYRRAIKEVVSREELEEAARRVRDHYGTRQGRTASPEESRHVRTASPDEPAGSGGDLVGIPYLLKDLFDVKGRVTACSSRLLEKIGSPAARDSQVQRTMREAGAIYCGRTHMNEFAYGLDGKNAHYGDCPHPEFPERISGGSSSGSAWSVATGLVPIAFGTDTGGSIRVPAALCGLFGFRRPVDAWARDGVFPLAKSFDTVGWFTTTAADMAESVDRLMGEGGNGLMGERVRPAEALRADGVSGNASGLAGVYVEPASVELDSELREAYRKATTNLITSGAEGVARQLSSIADDLDGLLETYNVIGSREAFEVHADWLDEYAALYDPAVWSLIDRGRRWKDDRIARAYSRWHETKRQLRGLLEQVDVLMMPATHEPAPPSDAVDTAYRRNILALTAPGSLAGVAVLTIPVWLENGLSGGLQCLLAPGREEATVRALLSGYFPSIFSM